MVVLFALGSLFLGGFGVWRDFLFCFLENLKECATEGMFLVMINDENILAKLPSLTKALEGWYSSVS